MKENISPKNYFRPFLFFVVIAISTLFTACEESENIEVREITINKVYLEDVNSTVPDREVTFIRLGQLMRIEGSGFTGLKKVFINGFQTYFNPVYVSDNSMLINVSQDTPTVDAEESVRNTITMVNDNYETTFPLEIRASAPSITNISNTLPTPGETIIVTGSGLIEISKVVFPGDVEVTTNITSDSDGEFFTVVVPEGISEDGGSIFIESSNGGAYSPAYFNFKKGVILDFDGNGAHGYWGAEDGSMIHPNDLESTSIGTDNTSQGNYAAHRPSRFATFAAAKNRLSEVWTGGDTDNWRGQITPYIPATTPLDEVAFQFDIYVPEPWEGTGFLKLCLTNGFNGGEWDRASYNYVPWIVNKEVEPFQTTGWTTVTIPLSKLYKFSEATEDEPFTFEDVLIERESANYKNFGIYFENSDFTLAQVTGNEADSEIQFSSASTSVSIYTDNWRIVSLETPSYTDFPE